MIDLMQMTLISCTKFKGTHLDIYRDKWGKWYVRNNEIITQRKLTTKEIVRYLANAMTSIK